MADSQRNGDEIPADWGSLWHARLPEQERHPYLFYDQSDRRRMLECVEREPWAGWWRDWQRIATRSKLAVRWWLLGNEEDARKCKLDLLERPIRPQRDTPGEMSDVCTEGPLRRATVTTIYQGCTVQRMLALVRGRYVVLLDRIRADAEHDYAWQLRSACPPGSPGTRLAKREVTWPGLSADPWREPRPGRTQLTTVVPPFAELALEKGRWRPISRVPEFANQVAVAQWRDGSTTALFALIPNFQDRIEVTWQPEAGQNLVVRGPGWTDRVAVDGGKLKIGPYAARTYLDNWRTRASSHVHPTARP